MWHLFTVIAKFKIKLNSKKKFGTNKRYKLSIERLKDTEFLNQYNKATDKNIEKVDVNNVKTIWDEIRKMISKTIKQNIELMKKIKYSIVIDSINFFLENSFISIIESINTN